MLTVPDAETSPRPVDAVRTERTLSILLHATAFLGAFLLFQVQPLLGKAVLPWFGGAAAVWTTAMLFFQTVLTAGYAFVFLTTRQLEPRGRSYAYMLCAIGAVALLPIMPSPIWKPEPDDEPVWRIILLLTACVGGPYFVLSMTGPLVQDWYFRAFHGRSPYRLFALSNFGSLCGLLTYPLVVEPLCSVSTQAAAWSAGFVVFAAAAVTSAWKIRKYPTPESEPPAVAATPKRRNKASDVKSVNVATAAEPNLRNVLIWCGLAAGGSLMLLATTNHVCEDVATVPLFWVVPLAVYLATFILCFEYPASYRRLPYGMLALIIVPVACWGFTSFPLSAAANLAMLFVVCMLCHGELVARRPSPKHLTSYYLCIAVGGALGGLFVGVVAPLIYNRYWEWMIATFAAMLLASIGVAASLAGRGLLKSRVGQAAYVAALFAGLGLVTYEHSRRFDPNEMASARNFYGVIVIRSAHDKNTGDVVGYFMRSGTTGHGGQVFADDLARFPITYYGSDTGVGAVLVRRQQQPRPARVGVIGLGAGTLAAYGRENDVFRFYELNPAVSRFADEYFTYLRDGKARIEVVPGDGRVSLEREPPQNYDVLVLDAFSSDAIPTHLITTEAFEAYLRHLAANGVLAIHVSNKHLNLAPVVAAAAERFHLAGYEAATPNDVKRFQLAAQWILLTRDPQSELWRSLPNGSWTDLKSLPVVRPWTDDFSNLLSAWR